MEQFSNIISFLAPMLQTQDYERENLTRHMCKTLEWVIRLPLLINDTSDNINAGAKMNKKKFIK